MLIFVDKFANRDMNAISYTHMTAKPSEQIGSHEHPTWELSYVVRGFGRRTMGGRQESFRTGEVVLVPPDLKHCWTFGGEDSIESITVQIPPHFLTSLTIQFPEMGNVVGRLEEFTEAIRFTGLTLRRLQTALKRMEGETDARRLVTLLGMLVTIAQSDEQFPIGRQLSDAEIRLERIKVFINCNYNHDICIDSIARHVGMNRSSLCTFFRRQTGQTLVDAINARRMEVARNLLRRRDLTIQQISFESGFKDVPYFYRFFKRMEGMTPREYREQIK